MQVELRVARAGGGQESITIEAANEPAAVKAAAARGLRVLSVVPPVRAKTASQRGNGGFSLMLFSQELLALLEAGLTLIEALQTLRRKETRLAAQRVLDAVLADLGEGRNFSDALAKRPAQFPELYVATIRAAERTGSLSDALSRYVVYEVQFDAIRRKLVSAAIYPAVLVVVGMLVILFLLGYVVPRFSTVYESAGREVPWLSGLLMQFGGMIYRHWDLCLGAGLGIGVWAAWLLRNAAARARMLQQVLRVPALARRADEFRLARFYRTLSLLLAAGIPLAQGLSMCSGLFSARQAAQLTRTRRAVEEGLPLSAALEREHLASAIGLSLIRVGEKSGRLADMLDRAARFHDDEFSRWIDVATRLLEPLLMVAMGIVIGGTVVLLYLPIFDLAGSLQ